MTLSPIERGNLLAQFNGDEGLAANYLVWVLAPDNLERLRNESPARQSTMRDLWRPSIAWVCALLKPGTSYREEFMRAIQVLEFARRSTAGNALDVASAVMPIVSMLRLHTGREDEWSAPQAHSLAASLERISRHTTQHEAERFVGISPVDVSVEDLVSFYEEIACGLPHGDFDDSLEYDDPSFDVDAQVEAAASRVFVGR